MSTSVHFQHSNHYKIQREGGTLHLHQSIKSKSQGPQCFLTTKCLHKKNSLYGPWRPWFYRGFPEEDASYWSSAVTKWTPSALRVRAFPADPTGCPRVLPVWGVPMAEFDVYPDLDSDLVQAPCLSHIRREKPHHPHGTAAIQKVTSGSWKSHQGRRITMAEPVSSMIHMPKSGRSIAHSRENDRYFAKKVHICKES